MTGAVPLTPIQHWFFAQELVEPHHFNQSVLLEVPAAIEAEVLATAVRHLLIHHDALRLRYVRDQGGWRQFHAGTDEAVPFVEVDLAGVAEAEQAAAIEAAAAELQASLNLSAGPIVRVALLKLGCGRSHRLLLVIHHLAVDSVSWRILLEDLYTAYGQLSRGEAVVLPAKTTSFKQWSQRLVERAQSAAVLQEIDYWRAAVPAQAVTCLPRDYKGGANTVASSAAVLVTLNAEETRALVQDVPAAYHTQINDALLTALVQAFAAWTGERALLVNLERHGRETLFEDLDLTRTVGWFTTITPVWLEVGAALSHPGEALKTVKERLRSIPQRGIGYGLLRYLSGNAEIAEQLESQPQVEVSFNYLGQFGESASVSGESGATGVRAVQESGGPMASLRGERAHLLEINGSVVGGQLQLVWTYSENFHRRATIERVAQNYMDALRRLITHCQVPGAGGYTPSDFSAARLSQKDLDRFLTRLGQSREQQSE